MTAQAKINLGNGIARRDSLNAASGVAGFRITERNGSLDFDAEAVAESSNPFWANWENNATQTYAVTIGSTPTNIIKMAGFYTAETVKYGDKNGIRKIDLKAGLCTSDPNTSNTELTITFV